MQNRVDVEVSKGKTDRYEPFGFCKGVQKGKMKAGERLSVWNSFVSGIDKKGSVGVVWQVFSTKNDDIFVWTPIYGAVELDKGNNAGLVHIFDIEVKNGCSAFKFKAEIEFFNAEIFPFIKDFSVFSAKSFFNNQIVVGGKDLQGLFFERVIFEYRPVKIKSLFGIKKCQLPEYIGFYIPEKMRVRRAYRTNDVFNNLFITKEIIHIPCAIFGKYMIDKAIFYINNFVESVKNLFNIEVFRIFDFEILKQDIKRLNFGTVKVFQKAFCYGKSQRSGSACAKKEYVHNTLRIFLNITKMRLRMQTKGRWDEANQH